jgi:hypothetical protein
MRTLLFTTAAIAAMAFGAQAFAQTASDPNPANPSAVKDGTPAAGTGSGLAPGRDPATAGKAGAAMGSAGPTSQDTPFGSTANSNNGMSNPTTTPPGSATGTNQPTTPPGAAGNSGPAGSGSMTDQGTASDTNGTAAGNTTPRHRMHSSMNGGGSGHWAHQPGTGESGPASAHASNIDSADTHSTIAPHLPEPKVGENAPPGRYLHDAERALAAHRTGEAQQALEMAETRLLDRSTAPANAASPDQNPAIEQVTAARKALASNNWEGARTAIQTALSSIHDENDGEMAQGGAAPAQTSSSGTTSTGTGTTGTGTTGTGVANDSGAGNSAAMPNGNGMANGGNPMGAGSSPATGTSGTTGPGATTSTSGNGGGPLGTPSNDSAGGSH